VFLAAALHRSSLSFARALSFLFCLPLLSSRALCVRELSLRPRWFIYKERTSTMSGGFFRGTSADQDTRFSNKMKKLLKSQKFAPELDVLVDMTKVKVDVIRPWIATRVTELLGFEDEVLINFIYGMLDGKVW
jgi:hypothetical protein